MSLQMAADQGSQMAEAPPKQATLLMTPPATPPVPMRLASASMPVVISAPSTPRAIVAAPAAGTAPAGPVEPLTAGARSISPAPVIRLQSPLPSGSRTPVLAVPGTVGSHNCNSPQGCCPLCHSPGPGSRTPTMCPPTFAPQSVALGFTEAQLPGRAITPPPHTRVAVAQVRPLSAGAPRPAVYGMSTGPSGPDRPTPPSSPGLAGPGASRRPRSAQSRMQDYSYLSMGGSPPKRSPGDSAKVVQSSTVRSGPRLLASPRVTARNITPAQELVATSQANPVFQAAWAELREHVESRNGRDPERPEDGSTPDPARLRRVCQVLVAVVNQIQEPTLRRVLTVLTEELFSAAFRDYTCSYDPRREPLQVDSQKGRGTSLPTLSEDQLATAVPYFAVVQSLRDTAKDAIVRRLELEAKASDMAEFNAEEEGKGRRAVEEVRLREELRHARLLADTYQARTLELEKVRIDLEDQVRRQRSERDKDDLRSQKLANEVKRLRVDADVARRAKQQWEAENPGTAPAGGRRGITATGSSVSSASGSRPGSARGPRTPGTIGAAFSKASRGLVDRPKSPRSGMLSSSATEPSPRRHGTGLDGSTMPRAGRGGRGMISSGLISANGSLAEESLLEDELKMEDDMEAMGTLASESGASALQSGCSARSGAAARPIQQHQTPRPKHAGTQGPDAAAGSSVKTGGRRSLGGTSSSSSQMGRKVGTKPPFT
mmetsp:Transcript_89069/g.157807  ORF Transcript_89069/g.157807 Transcript_89069/m.157807 type:complete len:716 (+) Transcript_89069:55-2202(+)